MAGAGMRDVKRRIKSVESTMQITKAMQLVASSKLRRAKERVETARPYFNTLYETICAMAAGNTDKTNLYTCPREVRRKAYVVIAGDRGLAGGYNVNILRFAESQMDPETALVIPVGKRAVDYFSRRAYETRVFQEYAAVESIDLERSFELARLLTDLFRSGEADEVVLVYTEFASMLSQVPACRKILPLSFTAEELEGHSPADTFGAAEFDPSIGDVMARIVPQFVGGMIFGILRIGTGSPAYRHGSCQRQCRRDDQLAEPGIQPGPSGSHHPGDHRDFLRIRGASVIRETRFFTRMIEIVKEGGDFADESAACRHSYCGKRSCA